MLSKQDMSEHCKVQVPQVRLHAAAALERLVEPGEDGCYTDDPITAAYRKLLTSERNKDVRRCLLGVIPLVHNTTLQVDCHGNNNSALLVLLKHRKAT